MAFLNPYEDVNFHRRSGIPGAAREILEKEALEKIDYVFNDFNEYFHYPAHPIPESELRFCANFIYSRFFNRATGKYGQLLNQ